MVSYDVPAGAMGGAGATGGAGAMGGAGAGAKGGISTIAATTATATAWRSWLRPERRRRLRLWAGHREL